MFPLPFRVVVLLLERLTRRWRRRARRRMRRRRLELPLLRVVVVVVDVVVLLFVFCAKTRPPKFIAKISARAIPIFFICLPRSIQNAIL
jgi:hypothetical protein